METYDDILEEKNFVTIISFVSDNPISFEKLYSQTEWESLRKNMWSFSSVFLELKTDHEPRLRNVFKVDGLQLLYLFIKSTQKSFSIIDSLSHLSNDNRIIL